MKANCPVKELYKPRTKLTIGVSKPMCHNLQNRVTYFLNNNGGVLFAKREGLKVTQRTNKNYHKGQRKRTHLWHAPAPTAAGQSGTDRR